MSQWHRANPELIGTDADPWMMHESYRRIVPPCPSDNGAMSKPSDRAVRAFMAERHDGAWFPIVALNAAYPAIRADVIAEAVAELREMGLDAQIIEDLITGMDGGFDE